MISGSKYPISTTNYSLMVSGMPGQIRTTIFYFSLPLILPDLGNTSTKPFLIILLRDIEKLN
jgi:hypothetical protein